MAALVQLFFILFLLWPAEAEFPAGPGWEWVPSMAEMAGMQFGEVAEPLVKMGSNAGVYPEIIPVEGWKLSVIIEPLWEPEGDGVSALVYEEVMEEEEEAEELQRVVIAFRGHGEEEVALEVMKKNKTFDYYSQAVAYTMRVLDSHPASSVLLTGTSQGGMVAVVAAAGILRNHNTALPIVAFLSAGGSDVLGMLGLSLQGHYTSIIRAVNEWDPLVRSSWDTRLGTVCLFPTVEPPSCTACYMSDLPSRHRTVECQDCRSITHDPFKLVDIMQLPGVNPTCYLMEDTAPIPTLAGAVPAATS